MNVTLIPKSIYKEIKLPNCLGVFNSAPSVLHFPKYDWHPKEDCITDVQLTSREFKFQGYTHEGALVYKEE